MIKPVVNGILETGSIPGLVRGVALTAAIYAVGALSTLGYTQTMVRAAQKVLHDIRRDLFAHLQTLPLSFFDSRRNGELMSLFTNDVDTISDALNNSFALLIQSFIQVVGTLVLLFVLNWRLSLLVVVGYAVMFWYIRFSTNRSRFFYARQQQALGDLEGYVEEMAAGQKVVKVFNHEQTNLEGFQALNARLQSAGTSAQGYSATMIPAVVSISYINYAVIAVLGGLMVMNGQSSLGSLASYLVFVRQSALPINQFTQQGNFLLAALPVPSAFSMCLTNSRKPMRVPSRSFVWKSLRTAPLCPAPAAAAPACGPGATVPTPPPLSFPCAGMYGSGMSALVTFRARPPCMMLRCTPNRGRRSPLSVPPARAKPRLPTSSTAFMISPPAPSPMTALMCARSAKVICAAALAWCCRTPICSPAQWRITSALANWMQPTKRSSPPQNCQRALLYRAPAPGYNTMVSGDGANLSQGQRQLLAIARAAVADPPVLILDEATSSIDTRTEALIEKGMDRLMEGRTVFVIAHRLSTVRNSNAIIVLEHGGIVERGSHDELLAQKGEYYQLYNGMFELA